MHGVDHPVAETPTGDGSQAGSSTPDGANAEDRSRRGRPPGLRLALVLFVVILLVYLSLLLDDPTVSWLLREEHPIELAGALSLFASAVACVVLWRRCDSGSPRLLRLSLLALAVLFVFGAGEEISWGERILGFEAPEAIQDVNAQDETTLHNLDALQGWLEIDRLFQVFWLVMGVVIPVAALWAAPRRFLERLVPILPVALAGLFVLNQILTRVMDAVFTRDPSLWRSAVFDPDHGVFEVKETVSCLLLAAGFWILVVSGARRGAGRGARAQTG